MGRWGDPFPAAPQVPRGRGGGGGGVAAQRTVTATGETGAADSNQERTGEANAEGVGSGSEGMASNHQKKDEKIEIDNATPADGTAPMQE